MVSVAASPRLTDDLGTDEEPSSSPVTDPRFIAGFRSLSLDSAGYSDQDYHDDARAFAGTPDPSALRKRKQKRESEGLFEATPLYTYQTTADGDAFRLAVLRPGTGNSAVKASLIWENSKHPVRQYRCLSYAWESVNRDHAILLDGFKFPVTRNLLKALQSLRKPKTTILIWIDQICINQDDISERGHQVSIMKHIFNRAEMIYVWLGEAHSRSEKLCEYAKRMRRGDDSPKSQLNKLLSSRELRYSIQRLLDRPWFQRVWVIPEVALSPLTTVVCGSSYISWENLVRLIRDVQLPVASGFDKQASLLGNPRQRVAIITQMIASQKEARAHTDITSLLILGKSSKATDERDMIFAFYGVTLLTTHPDYSRTPERLFVEIAHMYVTSILYEASYASWHRLSEEQKAYQLMSILYSAGALHQNLTLPSWVPDWTFPWHLAPVWAKTTPNFLLPTKSSPGKDEWSLGIRTSYRAGGDEIQDFEVVSDSPSTGLCHLRISAYIVDSIILINEQTPASTPGASQILPTSVSPGSPVIEGKDFSDMPTLRYGRHFFTTAKGYIGLATPGIAADDEICILLGGDVPVVIRPVDTENKKYKLLCECYVQSDAVMHGDLLRAKWTLADEIILV